MTSRRPSPWPGSSKRTEQPTTDEERNGAWLWSTSQPATTGHTLRTSCPAAALWPCGNYARTSARLRAALDGGDAVDLPSQGGCNADFYGTLLARLQKTVRAFYDIDGSPATDCRQGCCCPCFTLVRNEQEIILRDRQRQQPMVQHEVNPVSRASYQPTGPMLAHNPRTASGKASGATAPDVIAEEQLGEQPEKRAQQPEGQTQQASKRKAEEQPREQPRAADDVPRSPTTPYARVKCGDQVYQLVPEGEENTKPGASGSAHPLGEDDRINLVQNDLRHHLDEHVPVKAPSNNVSHPIDEHVQVKAPSKSVPHPIDEHVLVKGPARSVPHPIDVDATMAVPAKKGTMHELEQHETPGAWPGSLAHELEDDAP